MLNNNRQNGDGYRNTVEKQNILKKFFAWLARLIGAKGIIILLIVMVVIPTLTIGISRQFATESKTTKLVFEDIGELATQAAYCSDVSVIDESRQLMGVNIPFTKSKYIYSYDTVIKAGIDFGNIDWDEDDNIIKVKIPEVKVLSNEINLDSLKVYLEDESIFSPVRVEEYNDSMIELKNTAEADAIANGLLDDARSNAEIIIKGFLAKEYDLENYTVEFSSI